jgi:hypothetical protein
MVSAAASQAGWSGRQFASEVPIYQGPLSRAGEADGGAARQAHAHRRGARQVDVQGPAALRGRGQAGARGALLGRGQGGGGGPGVCARLRAHAHRLAWWSRTLPSCASPRRPTPRSRRRPRGSSPLKDLKPDALPRFFAAKAKLLGDEAGGHPLRVAAAKGDQALLNAVVDGAGELSVSDSFMILKVSTVLNPQGQLMAPPFAGGVYDLSTRAPIAGQLAPHAARAAPAADLAESARGSPMCAVRASTGSPTATTGSGSGAGSSTRGTCGWRRGSRTASVCGSRSTCRPG